MEPAGNMKHEEARRRLLEEGARSYLDAVSALVAFRQEVQKMCRTVLEKHLDDYSPALKLKVPLERGEIKEAEWPSLAKWEGDCWNLGVMVRRKKITPTIPSWATHCCLSYYSDAGLLCWICEHFPNKQKATVLYGKFRPLNKKIKCDANWVWIPHSLKVEEVCNLEANLEGIVKEWIELWMKVGGIKKAFEE